LTVVLYKNQIVFTVFVSYRTGIESMTDKVAIVTDTTACIPPEIQARYGIVTVPVILVFGDESYKNGVDMTTSEFYNRLQQAKELPTTSGASPDSYVDAYSKASREAQSILCITTPAKFSGMYSSACMAVNMSKEEISDLRIEVLDCGTAAAAQGLVVLAAAREAASGKGLSEVIEAAKRVMKSVKLLATLDTLDYLVKGGRVPKAAALASSLLQIKPIFTVSDGEAHPVTNVRTMHGAMNRILKIMGKEVVKEKPLYVAVMHADVMNRARYMKQEIYKRFDVAELFITEFTPVMGVHTGPGVVGVAFYNED